MIELPGWCKPLHIKGNQHADRLAGMAARYAQLPNHITEPIIKYIDNAKRIQLRLAAILCNLPSRPKYITPKSSNLPRPTITELMGNSRHQLIKGENSRILCTKCNFNIPSKGTNTRKLLMTECKQVRNKEDRPEAIRTQVYIGNKTTHDSHTLNNFRGLIYCSRCGASGSQRLYNLGLRCKPVDWAVQSHGREALKNINKGKLPRHIASWPDEAQVVFQSHLAKPIRSS